MWSEYGRMGLELAKDEINKDGIKGRRLKLMYEDSRSIPAYSVSAYQKLRSSDGASIIIGNIWSYLTNPLIPLSERDKTILFTPTGMPESIDRTHDKFFSMGERISSVSDAVQQFFKANPDVKRIGILCWEDTWGQAYLKIWRKVAKDNGVVIVDSLCTTDFANDFKTDVTKIVAGGVDAVVIAHNAETILRRLKEQRFTGKVLATSNIVEDIKVKRAPQDLFEGVFITDWRPNADFIEKFRKKFGKEPVAEAHNSYETLHAIARALGGPETDLSKALHGLKYSGVAGPIDFTAGPFANHSVAKLYKVVNNEFICVEDVPTTHGH